MNLDWLIIGGGIHGVHIAARLLGDAGVAADRLRIVDPGGRLLGRWRTCTRTTGMSHLRSPSAHHLDLSPMSLDRFAGTGGIPKHKHRQLKKRRRRLFAPPCHRPALGLFNAHCDEVIATFSLAELHIRARATRCLVDRRGATVELSTGGAIAARHVVLAVGKSDQPAWPGWAPRSDTRVHHVFESGFAGWPSSSETVVVVGGGISAGQIALRLRAEGHRVHLVSRHALRQHQFDSDPGWLHPEGVERFQRERDVDRRRALISEARFRGSMPPDVWHGLQRAIADEALHWHQSEVEGLDVGGEWLRMHLANGDLIESQRVLLATGFAAHRPGGALVDQLIDSAALPCARCGYPIVDTALRWHPRVHVSGPLAELEVGPMAPNIVGARLAADRLVAAVREKRV